MTGPAFDAHKIVEILDRHHVDYVLVGGFAAVLYGSRRPTEDIDIAPATSADNLHTAACSTACSCAIHGPPNPTDRWRDSARSAR